MPYVEFDNTPHDLPNDVLGYIKHVIEYRNGVWARLSKSYLEHALGELPPHPWHCCFVYREPDGEKVLIWREAIKKGGVNQCYWSLRRFDANLINEIMLTKDYAFDKPERKPEPNRERDLLLEEHYAKYGIDEDELPF